MDSHFAIKFANTVVTTPDIKKGVNKMDEIKKQLDEGYKKKLDQAKRVVEALEKLETDQVEAFANAIEGAATMNQLVKMNDERKKLAKLA